MPMEQLSLFETDLKRLARVINEQMLLIAPQVIIAMQNTFYQEEAYGGQVQQGQGAQRRVLSAR